MLGPVWVQGQFAANWELLVYAHWGDNYKHLYSFICICLIRCVIIARAQICNDIDVKKSNFHYSYALRYLDIKGLFFLEEGCI